MQTALDDRLGTEVDYESMVVRAHVERIPGKCEKSSAARARRIFLYGNHGRNFTPLAVQDKFSNRS